MAEDLVCYVKVRPKGAKRFSFLAPRGRINDLKVHAVRLTRAKALEVAAEILRDNADAIEAAEVRDAKGRKVEAEKRP